jgi:DNA-binding NtrC family response regulator
MFSIRYNDALPSLEDVINHYIDHAVRVNNDARDKTAKDIGIDRKTLYKRMRMFGDLHKH